MLKTVYSVKKPNGKRLKEMEINGRVVSRKLRVVPNQSMHIDEMVRRFVRGIPIDSRRLDMINIEGTEYDLEKLSRMDFGDKDEFSEVMASEAARLESDLDGMKERKRLRLEEERQKAAELEAKKEAEKPRA